MTPLVDMHPRYAHCISHQEVESTPSLHGLVIAQPWNTVEGAVGHVPRATSRSLPACNLHALRRNHCHPIRGHKLHC